ncbi:hypothetical protein ACE6H2_016611 [Prunus campanulata]
MTIEGVYLVLGEILEPSIVYSPLVPPRPSCQALGPGMSTRFGLLSLGFLPYKPVRKAKLGFLQNV